MQNEEKDLASRTKLFARRIIRLYVAGEHIGRIVDYSHCPWVISAAHVVTIQETQPAKA